MNYFISMVREENSPQKIYYDNIYNFSITEKYIIMIYLIMNLRIQGSYCKSEFLHFS